MARDTIENARGRWKEILLHFGIDPKFLTGLNGPCPFCGGKDRFRWDNKDGNGGYFCGGCKPGTGFQFLQQARSWDPHQTAQEIDKWLGLSKAPAGHTRPERTEEDKRADLRELLGASGRVVKGTAAWNYLCTRCGEPGDVLRDLWAIPRLRHSLEAGDYPALLALMRYADGTGASVHRTFLTAEGQKANVSPVRKIMPPPSPKGLAGSCVRLGPLQERVGIAEGIETAICAGRLFRLPVWAAISANGMVTWEPPEGVHQVVICADNDASFTGQQAAFTLAKRLHTAGIGVEIKIPSGVGQDWADVWQAQALGVA